jgi:hypothetical protein
LKTGALRGFLFLFFSIFSLILRSDDDILRLKRVNLFVFFVFVSRHACSVQANSHPSLHQIISISSASTTAIGREIDCWPRTASTSIFEWPLA